MKGVIVRVALVFVLTFMGVWVNAKAQAEVKTKTITYKDGGVTLKGLLAWDLAKNGKRPGILVVDEWWGLTNYAKNLARDLAGKGYVAFAADMYGDGKITNDPKVAKKWMTAVTGNKAV